MRIRTELAERYRYGVIVATAAALCVLLGCDSSSGKAYAIKATVSGLKGTGLVLQLNGGHDTTVTADGEVTLAYMVSGYHYSVSVKTQPTSPAQTCTVTNATGVMGSADVTNVTVACVTTYAISGSVSGLSGTGLVLNNKLGDDTVGEDLPISGNGTFIFPTRAATQTEYVVTVKNPPRGPDQTCSVDQNASGTIGSADVLNVHVTCSTNSYPVGGQVKGLIAGTTVVLRNNGVDLPVTNSTGAPEVDFSFDVADGAAYAVTVQTQPTNPWQTCTVTNGTGTIASPGVSNVSVSCTINQYAIVVNVSGLKGTGLILQNNGNEDLPITSNGNFSFATHLDSGATYSVKVKVQPSTPTQTCTIQNASGSITNFDITNVSVVCPWAAFVYVPLAQTYNVAAFAIDPDNGTLTKVSGSPFAVGKYSNYLTIEPTGKYAYVTNKSEGTISAFAISPAGALLSTVPGSPFTVGTQPGRVVFQPNGQFAYVSNNGSNDVSEFRFDGSNGAFSVVDGSPVKVGASPQTVTIDSEGKYAFVSNHGANNISTFTIDGSSGALQAVDGSPFSTGPGPLRSTIDPTGGFLYTANYLSNSISAFQIQTGGGLRTVDGSPFTAGTGPTGVIMDSGCKYVYTANNSSGDISAFVAGTTGALSAIGGSPFPTAKAPKQAVVTPGCKFLYVIGQANSVYAYGIDQGGGALKLIDGSPYALDSMPYLMRIDSSGRFLFVIIHSPEKLHVFTINSASGVLTQVNGSPYDLGSSTFPSDIAVLAR